MKNIALVLTLFSLTNTSYADDWTLQKSVRATQSQTVGQGLYIWTEGSWFAQDHRCKEKTVIYIVPDSTGNGGFEQVFAQVMAAQASGKKIQFGAYGDCDLGNPYFKPTFIRVFN